MNEPAPVPVPYPLDYQITMARIIGVRLQESRAAGRAEEMRDLERALARLSERDFGACAGCGALIAFALLEAQPAATRCAACEGRGTKGGTRCSSTS